MARRRRPVRVSYDDLYLHFIHEPGAWEASRIEYDLEQWAVHWTTIAETNCGMYLHRPPLHRECAYRRAPLNSVEFAHTGGDGLHYSFLVLDGHWSELSPVVVTIPGLIAGGPSNVVLGENLTEFLRLGIRTGYSALHWLVDEDGRVRDGAHIEAQEAQEFAEWVEPEMATTLRRLADRYGLEPLEGVAERLAELQHRYQPLLRRPPERHREEEEALMERLRGQFRPGDEVIWAKSIGGGWSVPVRAKVVAVTAKRVTIAAEDPDDTGAGVVIRHVSPTSLQHQNRGPAGQLPSRAVSGQERRRSQPPGRAE